MTQQISADALECPNDTTCFKWATVYHNISITLSNLDVGIYRARGEWTNKKKQTFIMWTGRWFVRALDFATLVRKRSPDFEYLNDAIGHIIGGGGFLGIVV